MSNYLLYMEKLSPRARLSANLRMLMQRAKWSERDLAQKSGVSQKTINNMLNERTQPGLDNVQMVAEAFNLNLMHLISETLEQDMNGGGTIAELTKHFVDSTPAGKEIGRASCRERG